MNDRMIAYAAQELKVAATSLHRANRVADGHRASCAADKLLAYDGPDLAEFFRLLADAQRAGRVAEYLAPVDLSALANTLVIIYDRVEG